MITGFILHNHFRSMAFPPFVFAWHYKKKNTAQRSNSHLWTKLICNVITVKNDLVNLQYWIQSSTLSAAEDYIPSWVNTQDIQKALCWQNGMMEAAGRGCDWTQFYKLAKLIVRVIQNVFTTYFFHQWFSIGSDISSCKPKGQRRLNRVIFWI